MRSGEGNLDLVVQSDSRDEVGHLSEAFNAMAASLREFRRSDQAKLIRIQRATQQAFDSLPDAVAVVDLEGKGGGGNRDGQKCLWAPARHPHFWSFIGMDG